MVYWIRHKFVTAKGDGTNTTLVKPTNWNEDHDIWMDEGTVIGRPPGSGSGPGQSIPLSSLFPAGMVMPYAGSTAPLGWLVCNGASILRADYPQLFTAIGGAYGAADANHFSLPDLRGRVVAGVDPGTGRLTGATINNPAVVAGSGGQETEQAYADVSVSGRGWGATNSPLNVHLQGWTNQETGWGGSNGGGPLTGAHQHQIDMWAVTDVGASVYTDGTYYGGGYTRAISNVQPTLMMTYVIKAS
jgi:microcystin-dependent protein